MYIYYLYTKDGSVAKRAVRIIAHQHRLAHIAPLFKEIGILRVDAMAKE